MLEWHDVRGTDQAVIADGLLIKADGAELVVIPEKPHLQLLCQVH